MQALLVDLLRTVLQLLRLGALTTAHDPLSEIWEARQRPLGRARLSWRRSAAALCAPIHARAPRNGHYHLTSDLDGTGYHPPQTRVQLRAALRNDPPDDAEHHRYHVIIAIRDHGEAACSRRSPEAGSTLRFRLAESTAIAAELVPMHRRCTQAGCHLRWPEMVGESGEN
jgi:hypothetical protein